MQPPADYLADLKEILLNHVQTDTTGHFTAESRLIEDVGFDSLDVVELVMEVEDRYDIECISGEESDKWLTIGDVIATIEKLLPRAA